MSTYRKIQDYVEKKYGFVPKTCWIADAKESCGIPVRKAWNRKGIKRIHPCPENKRKAILEAIDSIEVEL